MNSDIEIIKNKTTKFETDGFRLYRNGTAWGIIGGVGMALFLFALESFSFENSIGLKFFKYLVLLAVITYGLNTYKNSIKQKFRFKKGIVLGAVISFVSALSLVIMDIAAYLFTDSFAFNKFGVEPGNAMDFATTAIMVFFEVVVYGMIITFIILQFIKSRRPAV